VKQHPNRISNLTDQPKELGKAGVCNLLLAPLLLGIAVNTAPPASAQIIPDKTLPTNSTVPIGCTVCTITGGTVRQGNWFHSFSQFSLPTGGVAFFNNVDPGIRNIITRVTGGSISRIDGTLSANGTANLFLINPNGIVFGPNAQLNIGGSFVASTANSLRFSDGSEFSAVNPSASPLLTVNVPLGLQYGSNPGAIVVQGPGNNLLVNAFPFQIVQTYRPPGLQVAPGQTLALLGGDVLLQGGNLTAPDGHIELGSVNGGFVSLNSTSPGWTFNYASANNFGNILLSQAASADASGNSGGTIRVQAKQLRLTEGSSLLSLTNGSGNGGGLIINTTDSVVVSGEFTDPVYGPLFPSSLLSEGNLGSTGRSGNISITTGSLTIANGAQVSVSPFGSGAGGDLRVQAQSIMVTGMGGFGASSLSSDALNPDSGNAGNLTLTTGQLSILDGGLISASTYGSGSAGKIAILAQTVQLDGVSTDGSSPSSIQAQVREGTGQGGTIVINTNALKLSSGGQIATSTFDAGNAGDLNVTAQTIVVTGGNDNFPSGLFSKVNSGATGNGGNVQINAGNFQISGGAQITADTLGDGNAGNLTIQTQTLELSGFTAQGRSGLFAGAIRGSGAGGDLNVTAEQLIVRDGSTISVSNFPSRNSSTPPGQEPVGNLQINARLLKLDNGATLTAASAGGDRGNITINSDLILLRRGSDISTNALGQATGGNIRINTNFLITAATENSDITANAVSNFGGRVFINATGIYGIQSRSQLTPLSDITVSSALGPLFTGIVQITSPDIDPAKGLIAAPISLIDPSTQIAPACERSQQNRLVITGRGGLPQDASQPLRGASVWQDLRLADIPSNPSARPAAMPVPTAQAVASAPSGSAIVEAQGWVVDAKGQVTLVAYPAQINQSNNRFRPGDCPPPEPHL
jgi:filamentous hemagglutinin family protein